jgi:acyl-CoA dehydrogenase family protein 9
MGYENFLINLYFGTLDTNLFNRFQEFQPDASTRGIIQNYLEMNSEYPPAVLEERALGILVLAHLSIGIKGIVLFGNEEQKRKYLVPAASGEMIFSYALTEPHTGSDAQNIETTATLSEDGQHYILNGTKTYITNANYAGGLTVFAQMDPARPGFMGAFIVETSWDGVKIGKDMPKMGLKASSTASIQFTDVKVPKENLLGRPGDGFKIAMVILNYGRLALGAASAGMMKQSLRDMAKRSAERTQFGVSINKFELIQEKMVKAKVYGYVSSAMTAFTAGMLENNSTALVAMESSHCKLFGTTRAWETIYDALQVAGGSGYLTTQPYEIRMRDFRVTTIFEGTTEIHSIYPAMFVLRTLSKRMQASASSRISQLAMLIKEMFHRTRWPVAFNGKTEKRAARFARANARRIRLMILAGFLIYGQSMTRREFFLRRITTLSLYLYGIIAVLANFEAARKSGRSTENDRNILAYFLEEARQVKKHNLHIFPTRLEKLHKKITSDIIAGAASSLSQDANQKMA